MVLAASMSSRCPVPEQTEGLVLQFLVVQTCWDMLEVYLNAKSAERVNPRVVDLAEAILESQELEHGFVKPPALPIW
jgi:hypothetical protein